MSLKGFKEVKTNRYELEISVDAETFGKAIDSAYRMNVKKINVPGFRKGKAPKSIIEKYYGESVFYEDALNVLYPDAVESAIEESGLEFVDDKIDFDLVSMDREKGVEFKVVITVKPEAKISGYKDLKAERLIVEVTDEEVDGEINRMAERNSRLVTVEDRAAKDGDITVIDFEGFVDGTAFDGGKSEGFSLTLGSGQFIPGFEDQIIGHNTGDEFDVNVTFPEEYQAEELKGKAAVFKVKLHEIKVRELPVIDDEFAKDVSEFDTLEELKSDIKTKNLQAKNNSADKDVESQLIEQLVELVEVEVPQAMVDRRVEQSVQDFAYRLSMQGMDINTYMQYTGSSMDDFKKNMQPQALNQVKARLALEQIVKSENITVSEEEIAQEYEKLAEQYGLEVDKIKASIPEKDVFADKAVDKAVEFVKENAKISDVKERSAKEEAKAEKKEASEGAKKTKKTAKAAAKTTKKAEKDAE